MNEFLPPGFRFYPTEEELVEFYLKSKLEGKREDLDRVIPVLDIYSHLDPWQLQSLSGEVSRGDPEQWFFFSPRQEKETQGGRPNRVTPSGYWKATGSPCFIYTSNNRIVGVKKTMVFYRGRAPTGTKTKWKLNEYRAFEEPTRFGATPKLRSEFSVCRVYVKSGCLRAFDRRPIPSETNVHASHSRLQKDSSRINAPNIEEEKATRTSSSSVENLPISNTLNNMYKDIEDLLFSLDWE